MKNLKNKLSKDFYSYNLKNNFLGLILTETFHFFGSLLLLFLKLLDKFFYIFLSHPIKKIFTKKILFQRNYPKI